MPDSSRDFFAVTAPGLESLTASELRALGVAHVDAVRGGVSWKGDTRSLYSANLWLRTASRVLVRVSRFHAATFHELERRARKVPWPEFLAPGDRFRFRVTCHKSALYHSDAVAERLSRSIVASVAGALRGGTIAGAGDDEDEDHDTSAQLFVVRLDHDMVTISADSSGALLHRRGYRLAVAKAPLRETLAAAMVLSSGWDAATPLVDPMCGSGTIAIEAALVGRRIAPGIMRSFAFERWPGFRSNVWGELREAASGGELSAAPGVVMASDRDAGAVQAALENASRARVPGDVNVVQQPISALRPVGGSGACGWVITNPPYGVRVGDDVRDLYAKLGALLRTELHGWQLGMLTASPALDRQLRMPLEQVFETRNGGIKVRFVTGGYNG